MTALRAIPAGILAAASAVLAGASKLAELGARRLAPPADPQPERRSPYSFTPPPSSGVSSTADVPPAPSGGPVAAAESDAPGDVLDAAADDAAAALAVAEGDADADNLTEAREVEDVAVSDLVTDADLGQVNLADTDLAEIRLSGDAGARTSSVDADAGVTDDEIDLGDDTVTAAARTAAAVTDDAAGMGEAVGADPLADAGGAGTGPVITPDEPAALPEEASGEGPSIMAAMRTDADAAAEGTDAGADVPSLDEAVLGDDGEARTYESHIAELADHNVATVVREIQDLSTEELGQLFEYESAHRKRKTVLQAIERATAP